MAKNGKNGFEINNGIGNKIAVITKCSRLGYDNPFSLGITDQNLGKALRLGSCCGCEGGCTQRIIFGGHAG